MKNKSLFSTRVFRIFIASILGVSSVVACGWSFWTDHSVRFNSLRTGRGFYRLPPLPLHYDPVSGKEQTAVESSDENDWSEDRLQELREAEAKPATILETAVAAVRKDDLAAAKENLREYLLLTKYEKNPDRNAAIDILDVLRELENGATEDAVLEYSRVRLSVRLPVESPFLAPEPDERMHALSSMRHQDRRLLEDNWAYLRAADLYGSDKKNEALAAFRELVSRFPKSEKRESAEYMIGRILVESSYATATENCGIHGLDMWGRDLDPSKIEPAEKCRDDNWNQAMRHFRGMATRYPNGRYRNDVKGWIAFLHKRGSERPEALAEYYRLLGQTDDAAWRLEAKKSLQVIGHEYDDETLDKLESIIADEPQAALAYAYHRIYNHATDFSYIEFDKWCCSGENRWSETFEEKERVKKERDKGIHELERTAKFASAMVEQYGKSRVSREFLLRLAQAQLELENFEQAHMLVIKALESGLRNDSRAQALWVKGSTEHQRKEFTKARATLSQLLKEFPDHRLTEWTRRLLAIAAEDQDDLEFALDQYLALDYTYDVAYFVDIYMPTDRLAAYVADRLRSDQRDYLLYALGVRYMRDRKWDAARTTLQKVRTQIGTRELDGFEKEPEYWRYHNSAAIKTEWVTRDLQTIDDLQRLEITVESETTDERKAEAMYQLASYQYDGNSLLFYNPAAWHGMRHMLLYSFADGDTMRLPAEQFQILESSRSHETFARAIPIFLDIVDRFPNTKAAEDALYSAVIAHERLNDLNPYWREVYSRGFTAGPRYVTNADINRLFPKFRWPRSRLGWEAGARTVNGGSAYLPLPKPPPKLTTEQRVVRKLGKWKDEYGPWVGDVASWAWGGIKGAAAGASGAIVSYLQNYYYLVYMGFMGAIFWQSRKEIYEGPVTKGALLAHRGLLFIAGLVRQWWLDIAVPSIIHRDKTEKEP